MTAFNAALKVLQDEGKALHYQAITKRVNGKKVTKHLQIFFDLDEQFMADPFSNEYEKAGGKYVGLPQITSTDDYLAVLVSLLQFIRSGGRNKRRCCCMVDG